MVKNTMFFGALLLTGLFFLAVRDNDRLFWPKSGYSRIDEMAVILRKIEGPAKWCYSSEHEQNLAHQTQRSRIFLEKCISKTQPIGDYEEVHKGEYIRRFYRASIEANLFCEVTLSTVRDNDRVVGSDCYYGLFEKSDDTGVGLTADPFG